MDTLVSTHHRANRLGLICLLRAVARGQADLPLTALDERLIRWAIDTGLGALLLRATADDSEAATSPLWPLVKGADLTARVLSAQHIDATTEIIDACQSHAAPLVLLKGISVCDQYYPEPHLRPMRDIDILVEDDAVPVVEALVSKLGYLPCTRKPAGYYDTHHHGCPLVHPDTGVWVEIHRALCSPRSDLGSNKALGLANLKTQLRSSEFMGRRVRRLSKELQIVHLACHWADGLQTLINKGALGDMVAMVDLVFMLKHDPAVHWEVIVEWTEGSLAGRYVYLLLGYLDKHGLIDVPSEILRGLRPTHIVDRTILSLAHTIIDRHVVDGRDSGLLGDRHVTRIWRTLVFRRPLMASASRRRNGFQEELNSLEGAHTHAPSGPIPMPRPESRHAASSPTIHPKQRSDVQDRMVEGQLVILDRRQHVVHQLNQTAHYVWDRCDGHHTVLDIAVELARAFDVDTDTAAHDVDAAVRQLEAVGLLETA